MIPLSDRQHAVTLIDEAVENGARRMPAAQILGLSVRTVERWRTDGAGTVRADRRPTAVRPRPKRRLSAAERAAVLQAANSPAFASLPPSQIVPKLADQGRYVVSESTFYRVLKGADPLQHTRRRGPHTCAPSSSHQSLCDGPQSSVVLGHHLAARRHQGDLLLLVHDPRYL